MPVMDAPRATVGCGSAAANPTAGPPMLFTPMISPICNHVSNGIANAVSLRNIAAASRISFRFALRGISGETRMSATTSCIMWRLSKTAPTSGYRRANVGAIAGVIGIR